MTREDARILVVDDNEDNRFTLSRRLKKNGYRQLETAVNGVEALEKIRSEPFDLVLLDIMMPEMDGYEVLETVKKDESLRHIPIIMISAADELESVVKCIELGAEDFLPKPFNATLLRARVSASLENKQLRDQEEAYRAQILAEQKRTDELLHAIIPATAVRELKETGVVRPRNYEGVGILFCDIVGFTAYCDRNLPETVVAHLQALIEAFEAIVEDHQMEKIKTIGDAFMATSGLLRPVEAPLLTAVRCGLEMGSPDRTAFRTGGRGHRRQAAIPVRCLGRHGEYCRAPGRAREPRRCRHDRRCLAGNKGRMRCPRAGRH